MVDYDELKWFVAHENVTVYQDNDGTWMAEFATPCKCLTDENTCAIYHTRPMVCADYDPDNCTANSKSKPYRILFTEPDEVDAYMKKRWKKKPGTSAK